MFFLPAQCLMNEFLHDSATHSLRHSIGQTPINIRYLESFNAVVHDIRAERDAIYLETPLLNAFRHDGSKKPLFVFVEVFADFFHHNDVAEELGSEVSVALNGFLDHVEVSVDDLDEFIFRLHRLGRHISHLLVDALKFSLDDRPVNLLLTLERMARLQV